MRVSFAHVDVTRTGVTGWEPAAAAQGCKGRDLYLDATQTVFGAGSPTADIMLVGFRSPWRRRGTVVAGQHLSATQHRCEVLHLPRTEAPVDLDIDPKLAAPREGV
jgi:uracil-DNA glycosylase